MRTKTVKKSARFLIEKYYSLLTTDFQINKRFCDEVALIPSKGLRNKISGFVTHLMKRLSRGGVKGLNIDIKEKNLANNSEQNDLLNTIMTENKINVDKETEQMLKSFLFGCQEILEN